MPQTTRAPKSVQSALRMTEETDQLLKELENRLGLSRSDVLTLAVRKLAQSEGIKPKSE